jgi:hypothetical protein
VIRELVRRLLDQLRNPHHADMLAGLTNAQIDAILDDRRNRGAP